MIKVLVVFELTKSTQKATMLDASTGHESISESEHEP